MAGQEKTARRYAVVDLEATGSHVGSKIIQVGIVIIENDKVIETYHSDVNPQELLSPRIRQLTGITDKQLRQAPVFSQIANTVYDLLEGAVFVAHNVAFDATLLAEELFLEGYHFKNDRVDTVELAQIVYPTYDRYSLSYLTKRLHISHKQAHTALSDAIATAHLFLKIKDKLRNLPQQTLMSLVERSDALIYETGSLLVDCLSDASKSLGKTYSYHHGLVLSRRAIRHGRRGLKPDFVSNMAQLGLKARPLQEEAAEAMDKASQTQTPFFLEAPSGMGKTYVYLLSLLANSTTKTQIVVSTPTKLLQDQMMAKEGHALTATFGTRITSLKGPRNYIDLAAFHNSLSVKDPQSQIERIKMQILVWLTQTMTGDLDELKQQRHRRYYQSIRHNGNTSKSSPFFEVDFWQKKQDALASSQVIITNHAYLLTRLADDPGFVAGKRLVLDEVQELFLQQEKQSHATLFLQPIYKHLLTVAHHGSHHLLEKRLSESLLHGLNSLEELLKSGHIPKQKLLKQINRDVVELNDRELIDLAAFMAHDFDWYWLAKAYHNGDKVPVLSGAKNNWLNFYDSVPTHTQIFGLSATLHISRRMSVPDLLGFPYYDMVRLTQKGQRNQELLIVSDSPSLYEQSPSQEADYIGEILSSVGFSKRPILVLLTSYEVLTATSHYLAQHHIPHLAQEEGQSVESLRRRFENGDSQILLATGAFWSGVDFIGLSDMVVIIPRIPFANPKSILSKKMNHTLKKQGFSPFYDYHLPSAIMKLQQAMGRSRRRENQASTIILLDNRANRKSYGKTIQKNLAQQVHMRIVREEELREIITNIW